MLKSYRFSFLLISLLAVFTLLIFGSFWLGQRLAIPVQQEEKLLPIYSVDTDEKKISITIDGVWGADQTPRILDIFQEHDIQITFFFGGYWLEKFPEMAKRIVEEGHEIGNHSYTHPHCSNLTPEDFRQELQKTSDLIYEITQKKPVFFRPPFGDYNNMVISVAEEEGYKVIQWSIDSLDWKNPGKDFIIHRVLEKTSAGDIILMHNNGKYTADALAVIVPHLKSRGFKIVPLSRLVYEKDYYIEKHTGVQKPLGEN